MKHARFAAFVYAFSCATVIAGQAIFSEQVALLAQLSSATSLGAIPTLYSELTLANFSVSFASTGFLALVWLLIWADQGSKMYLANGFLGTISVVIGVDVYVMSPHGVPFALYDIVYFSATAAAAIALLLLGRRSTAKFLVYSSVAYVAMLAVGLYSFFTGSTLALSYSSNSGPLIVLASMTVSYSLVLLDLMPPLLAFVGFFRLRT